MSTKKIMLPAAIAMALGAGNASAFLIDFDGAGGVDAKNVSGFDPAQGNVIIRCAATPGNCTSLGSGLTDGTYVVESFGHSFLTSGNFSDENGDAVNFGTAGEWTLVFGFTELSTIAGLSVTSFTTGSTIPGTANFFELYYQAAGDSSMTNGTGFNNGTKILAGTIDAFDPTDATFGRSDFTVTNTPTALDQFGGVDNYAGKTSVSVNGNLQLKLTPTFRNGAFFIDPIDSLVLAASSQLNLPFTQTNPSGCFVQTAGGGAPNLGGAGDTSTSAGVTGCGDTIGAVNGVSGPNVMFQTDANVALQASVPEPTTLALLGGSFLAVGAARRFNKKTV